MKFIDSLKAHLKGTPEEITEAIQRPPINMPAKLRQNASGLEMHYGTTQFIERIRAAADAIEDLEATLMVVMLNSNETFIKEIAEEALQRYDERRR